jgi:hypothetical protein
MSSSVESEGEHDGESILFIFKLESFFFILCDNHLLNYQL